MGAESALPFSSSEPIPTIMLKLVYGVSLNCNVGLVIGLGSPRQQRTRSGTFRPDGYPEGPRPGSISVSLPIFVALAYQRLE